jgi:DNA-binding IclR family transcriptional regulator
LQSSIIQKSVAILEVLSNANRPQTFTDIQKSSTFNKSTVHRLLSILTTEGLVQFDPPSRTYLLGGKLLQLARNADHGFELHSIAFDEMLHLNVLTQENVTIGVLRGHEIVYLRVIDADYDWGMVQRPGRKEPVHSTATGKSIVAFLPPQVLNQWLDQHEFTAFTDRTITSRTAFEVELEEVRNQGFSTSHRETDEYVNGISAPIFNYVGEPVASLNIWAPNFRHSYSDLLDWVSELKAAANRVTERIGGVPGQE